MLTGECSEHHEHEVIFKDEEIVIAQNCLAQVVWFLSNLYTTFDALNVG